jgi:hypothetical protein
MADIGEGVGQALETATEITDGEIPLLQTVEVLQGRHSALCRIVEEEPTHSVQSGERRRAAMEHHVANGLGHGEVNPGGDAMVDLCPRMVVQHGLCINGAVDMIEEAEFAESELKKGTPGRVV